MATARHRVAPIAFASAVAVAAGWIDPPLRAQTVAAGDDIRAAVPPTPVATRSATDPSVTSAAPVRVGVTIYRAPDRSGPIDHDWLDGYALVTETRRVTIPAGTATLRFEGVAGGLLAESAIVTGLPAGVAEKNLDAELLNPRTLYDRSLARPVTIRRTDPAGRVAETRAIIRSAAAGAIVVQTAEGVEALQCSGLPEALVYDGVPPGLSARPTLSIETASARAHEAEVTLSYLAWGFDWQADYVVEMALGGGSARLFAWITLASGDPTGFVDAETAVVAGRVNREDRRPHRFRSSGALIVRCGSAAPPPPPPPPAPPPPPPPPAMAMRALEEIVVTGARIARQEDLGDLKLYRVPFRTTVAANAQKQVALLDKAGVPVRIEYRTSATAGDATPDTRIFITARNRSDAGLGVPLPAGQVAVFEPGARGRQLVGEGSLADRAIGEDVEIDVAAATQVRTIVRAVAGARGGTGYEAVVTNATPQAVTHEYRLRTGTVPVRATGVRLARDGAERVWRTVVPANGSARLRFTVGN